MIAQFLQALYHPEIDVTYSNEDYAELLTVIEHLSIGAQVYSLLKSSGRLSRLPPFARDRLTRIHQSVLIQNLLVKRETELLLREFDRQGIEVIPLKGTLMAERYYGHYSARGTSDIDLLIKPEQMRAAIDCIVKMGYSTPLLGDPAHYHVEWSKPLPGRAESLIVELHWSFASSSTSRMNIDAAWEAAERLSGYQHARILGTTYTFYSLCLHGASHQMESLKYVLDLYHLLKRHHDRIDLIWVWRQAHLDRTRKRVKAALSIVYALFPELHSVRELPFRPNVRFWNIDDVLQSDRAPPRLRAIKKKLFVLAVMDTWRYRLRYVLRFLFPSRNLARYSVDESEQGGSLPLIYYRLYKQRLRKLFGGMQGN